MGTHSGYEFCNKSIDIIKKIAGVKHIQAIEYNLHSNSQAEIYCKIVSTTVIKMYMDLLKDKKHWQK